MAAADIIKGSYKRVIQVAVPQGGLTQQEWIICKRTSNYVTRKITNTYIYNTMKIKYHIRTNISSYIHTFLIISYPLPIGG